jgi:hypothetical protein
VYTALGGDRIRLHGISASGGASDPRTRNPLVLRRLITARQQVGIRSMSAFLAMVGTHASARIGADAAKVDVVEANTWQ